MRPMTQDHQYNHHNITVFFNTVSYIYPFTVKSYTTGHKFSQQD